MDPLLVITNSDAGSADQEGLEAALSVLRGRASVEVAATANPGELDGVLHRAASRRIVVAGGDGSLHAVVAALHKRNELKDKVLGLIPLGTGNDFARGTGIPLDPADAAELILHGEVRPVDLLVDELGEVVVNSVHAGVGAQASRRGGALEDPPRSRQAGPARLPHRRRDLGLPAPATSACTSSSTARSSSMSTSECSRSPSATAPTWAAAPSSPRRPTPRTAGST